MTLPSGRVLDITLAEGRVTHAGASQPSSEFIDCTGLIVIPAAIDMHVHMRGGSQSKKEDWKSGSMSALAGGVTVVVDQPNTVPPINTPQHLHDRACDAQKHSFCNFAINSSVTPQTPLEMMGEAGALAYGETFFAPSSYGEGIGDTALQNVTATGSVHWMDLPLFMQKRSLRYTDTDLIAHDLVRSPDGEVLAVKEVGKLNAARIPDSLLSSQHEAIHRCCDRNG